MALLGGIMTSHARQFWFTFTAALLVASGKSGWFTLLGFVPIANIVLVIWLAQDGQPGTNEYGPNPKDMLAATA
jgi:uncharacterized membrane protein YhaH (DUF805 family)